MFSLALDWHIDGYSKTINAFIYSGPNVIYGPHGMMDSI